MKITDVKSFPISPSRSRSIARNLFVLKIETDEGIHGWGESGVTTRELAVKGAVTHFSKFLIGKDPMRIGALWQEMYRSQYFEGGRILTGAISAIDIAIHDIVAKKLNVPVYQLLGGAQRDYVPCFATSSAPMGPEVVDDTKRLLKEGWKAIRLVGFHPDDCENKRLYEPRESIARTAEWVVKVREEVGQTPILGVEYHHRLNVSEAASFCHKINAYTLDFLEEPIRDESPDAYAMLRQMTNVPFAIGEEFSSKWIFLPFIERGLTNFARLDICNVGGFTEAMKVAGWCEAHYIDLMPHDPMGPISTAANIHLAAAVPNYAWLEARPENKYDKKVFPIQPQLKDTKFVVPKGAGLGVEFNEDFADEPFTLSEMPHLHRRDGSFTNY